MAKANPIAEKFVYENRELTVKELAALAKKKGIKLSTSTLGYYKTKINKEVPNPPSSAPVGEDALQSENTRLKLVNCHLLSIIGVLIK